MVIAPAKTGKERSKIAVMSTDHTNEGSCSINNPSHHILIMLIINVCYSQLQWSGLMQHEINAIPVQELKLWFCN